MSQSKLIKRIRRELTANPKKAVGLGLLAAVALYFWAPLVWGWIAPASPPSPAAVANTASSRVPTPEAAAHAGISQKSGETKEPAPYSWQQIVQWRQQDPRTVPAKGLLAERDPFQKVVSKSAELEAQKAKENAKQKPIVPTWTPESLGLRVSSTIVGSRRSVALINGRAYSQGETIELASHGKSVDLTVSEIHPGRIVLRYLDQQVELTIPERGADKRLERVGNQ